MKNRYREQPFTLQGARLSLKSLIMLFAVVGFASGALFGLLFAPMGILGGDFASALIMLLVFPLASAINGAIAALLGYPVYAWIMNRYFTHSLTGYALAAVSPAEAQE